MLEHKTVNENKVDLFTKCIDFLNATKHYSEQGLYPYFRSIESAQDTEVFINKKKYLMLGSNSYMGLTNHPKILKAAKSAIDKYGSGNAGSRFLNGTLDIHNKLEEKLADYFGFEDAVLFGTGYLANLGVISALVGPKDYVITDKMDHASIFDASRLSFGKLLKFKHNDMRDLERVLKSCNTNRGKLVVVDGVFSMEGDIANLPGIVELCRKYNARIMVDDAHGTGVLGQGGRGTPNYFDLVDSIDILVITFSKSLASLGGAALASKDVIYYLKHKARSLIFSASMPASAVTSVSKALDIIQEEPSRITRLWYNTNKMLSALNKLGFNTGTSNTPIIPIIIGDMDETFIYWRKLTDAGIFVNPVVPPAVQPGQCLIRTSYMATHTDEQLDWALEVLSSTGKELNLI